MSPLLRKTGAFFVQASTALDAIDTLWKFGAAILTLIAVLLLAARNVDAVAQLPTQFQAYVAQDTTMHNAQLQEMKRQTWYLRRQDCFTRTPRIQWVEVCLGPSGPTN